MTKLVTKLILAAMLLASVYLAGKASVDIPPEIVVDSLSLRTAERRAQRAELEVEGLRARLRGLREAKADTIYIIRDSIPPPDTVYRYVAMSGSGRLETMRLASFDSIAGKYTDNRLLAGIDVSKCDDGWSLGNNARLVCNEPRLGHLYLFGNVGVLADTPGWEIKPLAAIGIEWEKYYRSKYSIQLGVDLEGRIFGGLKRRFEIF